MNNEKFWAWFTIGFCLAIVILLYSIQNTQEKQLEIMQRDSEAVIKASQQSMVESDAIISQINK